MKTVVITDGKYRSSIAAARVLGRAGYRVIITQTRGDETGEPPVFASRYVAEDRWVDGAAADPEYTDRLLAILNEYEHPVLLCVGATSLNAVAKRQAEFGPGGSIRDDLVIEECNKKGMVMAFTGMRLFHH